IIGGIIIPPVEATDSTAPANLELYPTFFIRGIVKTPVVTTLAVALPLTLPINPLPKLLTLAGPPRTPPNAPNARSTKTSPTPDLAKKAPNKTNMKTIVAATSNGIPNIPVLPKKTTLDTRSNEKSDSVEKKGILL